jgi:hypothetical protein
VSASALLTAVEINELVDARALHSLRDVLRTLDYSGRSLGQRLSAHDTEALLTRSGLYSFYYADDLADGALCDQMFALFWLNATLSARNYLRLPLQLRELLQDLRLVIKEGEQVRGAVAILEVEDTLLLSDHPFVNAGNGILKFADGGSAFVMPVHASSFELLDHIAVDAGCRAILDIGCGSGALALLLAHRYERVSGVDINERAVAFSRVNAALNGQVVQFAHGDIKTMRSDRSFCHAVFNAPCEIPYREVGTWEGMALDEIAAIARRATKDLLSPGGLLQVHCVVSVPQSYETPREVLVEALQDAGSGDITVTVVSPSPFELNPTTIAGGEIPRDSHLLACPDDDGRLLNYLRENAIREAKAVILTISA